MILLHKLRHSVAGPAVQAIVVGASYEPRVRIQCWRFSTRSIRLKRAFLIYLDQVDEKPGNLVERHSRKCAILALMAISHTNLES